MPEYEVTQELIIEQVISIDAASPAEASDRAANGEGEVINELTLYPTTIFVNKTDD